MTVCPLRNWVVLALLGCSAVVSAQPPPTYCHPQSISVQRLTEKDLSDALDLGPLAEAERGELPYRGCPASSPGGVPRSAGRVWIELRFKGAESAGLEGPSLQALKKLASALQSDRLAGFAFKLHAPVHHGANPEKRHDLSKRRVHAVIEVLVTEHRLLPERLSRDPELEVEFADSQAQWRGGGRASANVLASFQGGLLISTVRVRRR